jgi:hypothetical protein
MSTGVELALSPELINGEALFFDVYKSELETLFQALGRSQEWRDNPVDLLPYTQPNWVGKEHGNSVEKDQFSEEQCAAAARMFPKLGMSQEFLPAAGSFEQVIIVGGMMRVNRERMQFTHALLESGRIATDKVVFWAGQRLREERDDQHVAHVDMSQLGNNLWVKQQLARSDAGSPWLRSFATETELAQLAYLEHHPEAHLNHSQIGFAPRIATVPQRTVAYQTFSADASPDFTLMHCAAVAPERPGAPVRHTSASCAREWLQSVAPEGPANVLMVSGNPHTLRNARELTSIIHEAGRDDLKVSVCGPAASPKATTQLILGESARLLYMDAMTPQPQGAERP